MATDVEILCKNFDRVTHWECPTPKELIRLLAQEQWDILDLLGLVKTKSGSFCFRDIRPKTEKLGPRTGKITARSLVRLVEVAKARLVIFATCQSMALAAQLAEVTNVVAAAATINTSQAATWADLFYGLLADGKPLTQAFDIAKEASACPLVLITRKDFRVLPKTAQ